MIDLEEFTETLRDYFYDNGNVDIQVELDEDTIYVYLDLPSVENYEKHMYYIERFFNKSLFDVEDFEIDGDYEGQIEIFYIGE